MSVQNIVLIVSVVGLLFSFYYIYTLDSKLRELKREIKTKEEYIYDKKDSENEPKEDLEQKQKITFSDDVYYYNKEEQYSDMYPESVGTVSDMTIISESELDENQDQYSEPIEEQESDVISKMPITINYIQKDSEQKENKITETQEEENIDDQVKEEIQSQSESQISEEQFPPDSCRVKIKTGPRKGELCGKKTSGTPYCSRHGLYV